MNARDYLDYIAREIHTTVVATVDADGAPVTCAIDMMDADETGLYFLTAKGKGFYDRLVRTEKLALTALNGEDTMHSVAVSVRGHVVELGPDRLPDLFEKNPYMRDIYPSEASRSALTVFKVDRGAGEWFDLSKRPIERASFTFGGALELREGYYVRREACIGCGACLAVCPQNCIHMEDDAAVIEQEHCLHCGRCAEICTARAIVSRKNLEGEN